MTATLDRIRHLSPDERHLALASRVGPGASDPVGAALGLTLAAKYLRISDDDEGRELGVTRQSEDLDVFAARERLHFVETYSDNDVGASTRTRKSKIRKDYLRMLGDAKAGHFGVIAAYTAGRLTRRPRENEDLIELAEQYGVRYKYIRSPEHDLNTADGRMMCRWLAAADTGEAERIAERVSRAALQRATKGEYNGGNRPFGYGVQKTINGLPWFAEDGTLVLDYNLVVEAEAAEIRRAAEAVLAGAGVKTIARDWNDRGVTTTLGKPWRGFQVARTLTLPRLAGLKVYRGQILEDGEPAPWEPILKRDTWEALVLKLTDPSRRTSPGNRPVHLLTMALCEHADCIGKDNRMRVSNKGEQRNRTRMYRCQERGHNWINADGLDHKITELVLAWLEEPSHADLLTREDTTAKAKDLAAEASLLRERRASVKRMFAEGHLDEGDLRVMIPDIEAKLATIEAQQAELAGITPLKGIVGRSDARELWGQMDLGRKKAIIDTLMTIKITSSPRHGGRLPTGELLDHSRVHIEWRV